MLPREVVVTGIGLATPLGDSIEAFTRNLFGDGGCFGVLETRHAAPLPVARVVENVTAGLSRSETSLGDRSSHLALLASTRALGHAGWRPDDDALRRCGVFVGCGSGPTHALDDVYAAIHQAGRLPGLSLLRCLPSGAAAAVALRHGLRGPNQTYATACASSAIAIGEALRAIRHGYLDMAVVGGSEAPFGDVTVKAWEVLRVLAPLGQDATRACRPFDRSRNGIVLGEGAAFFVLESAAQAQARGARVHARLLGYGASGDGHHWTEPNPDGQCRAMQAAIADAGLALGDIRCINAHGTGTSVGDRVEAASIAQVFGTSSSAPWVHSTKSQHGHALGASGAIELAAVISTLRERCIPATRNLERADDLPIHLVGGGHRVLPPTGAVLSNSFAFGGSNASLVVAAPLQH